MQLSIIIPIYNEAENIEILYQNLKKVLDENGYEHEIILINDGSKDASLQKIEALADLDKAVKVINFRRNFGQTAAMSAGIDHAEGDVIIPMDADNQNDPQDIPRLMAKLKEGYTVVSGWRRRRKDKKLSRILPSKIANAIISVIGGVKLHDYGCSLKAYRKEIIKDVKLYGEMHRFIPIYASWQGADVTEIEVNHHPRLHGTTKYGINRTFKVILDLLLIKYIEKYFKKPIYLFGGFGLINFSIAIFAFLYMLYLKIYGNRSFIQTPLPQLVVMFFILGVLSLFIGILSEIVMRTYYESQDKKSYTIKNKINME